MKITFSGQTAQETGKQYEENRTVHGQGQAAQAAAGYGRAAGKSAPRAGSAPVPGSAPVAGAGYYAAGSGWEDICGKKAGKGKSLIELQQEAENMDVAVSQDYMTVMSHTMSEEDYAEMQEEGFDFGGMDPEEAVTIVDKIKAELVRAGKNVAGYTDDLNLETLAAALGSESLARTVADSFARADLPLTKENLEAVGTAWAMAEQLNPMEEGSIRYLIDNGLESEVWNLYLAENSGAAAGGGSRPAYCAEDVEGYYGRSAGAIEEKVVGQGGESAKTAGGEAVGRSGRAGARGSETSWQDSEFARQIDSVIGQAGRTPDQNSRRDAAWLLENGLPLTSENLRRLEELKNLELPVSPERFAEAAAGAVAEGKSPVHASLAGKTENLYEKAVRLEEYYQSDEAWESCAGDVTARRQLEEIRLRMTAEVNIKLLKSGFSIDTAPMEKLVEALRAAEGRLAEQYFPGDSEAVEKYRTFSQTYRCVRELPGLPADVLGTFAEGQSAASLKEFHGAGKALQDTCKKAGESYEALMTAPRGDMGDNIKKAFANVDDILKDLGQELTEENRRAARILGYNRMEMTVTNLEKVREADRLVQGVVEKLTPASTLKMIRDGVNPLEKSFEELRQYFEELPEDYREQSESYSRFLYHLERKHDITPEERESYIGIYRLVRQIEKTDGAAVGSLVNAQAELHFSNLLSAVRSGKAKSLDRKVGETFGEVAGLVRKGESISEQIGKAFASAAKQIVTQASYSEEADRSYNAEQLNQYREAAAWADKETVALLYKGELPASVENLLAARALTRERSNPFRTGREEKRGTELWEQLDRPEAFAEEYEETVASACEDVEEATPEEAETSLDVRAMQLAHRQLTIAGALAKKQEFFLPVYIGDRMTRVHLTMNRDGSGAGTVDIEMKTGPDRGLSASFRFVDHVLEGNLTAENQNEVMETQKIADIFKEEAGESWRVGEISVGAGNVRSEAAGMGTDAETENVELYRVAKVFLHAVQMERVSNEN